MHIFVESPKIKSAFPNVVVELTPERQVRFKAASTFKSNLTSSDVFEYINEYWKTLEPELCEEIFNCYSRISDALSVISTSDEVKHTLSIELSKILDLNDINRIHEWLIPNMERLGIDIPGTILHEYVRMEDDNRGSREQTYIVEDYIWLLCLSIVIRSAIPVWAEYIEIVVNEVGNDFKELKVFQLVYRSQLYQHHAFEKLRSYIFHNLKPEDFQITKNIFKGINSTIFFDWLLGLICVRRLGIKDIRIVNPEADPVKFIYQYIRQRVNPNDTQGKQINFIKKPTEKETGGGDDKNKYSTLEIYKQKQDVAAGEIIEIEYSLSDIERCADKLHPLIDMEFVNKCRATAKELRNHVLSEPQITLLKWVFAPVVSPKGISYISKDRVIDALGICQAVLWTRGHKYLALLSTCYSETIEDVMSVNGVDSSKTKLSKEIINELNELYPFSIVKKKNEDINLVVKSINSLADKFSELPWRYTASKELVDQVCPDTNNNILPAKLELKTLLAHLAIEIGSRNY